jgi:methionyl-tRNA synthetase
MVKPFYITTAIDYVNGNPHVGHAYEKTLADVIARWHRLKNEKVFFLTGTDDNAQKNAQAAKESNTSTQQFVDKNAKTFEQLCKNYHISNDFFIRTTSKEHIKKSQEIISEAYRNGLIYKDKYDGLYCEGCEGFITEKELIDGKCPEHDKKPREISEDAYFFKLSLFRKQIIDWIKKEKPIVPQKRANEVLYRLENEELKDLCISRKNADWGINIPFDKNFKIYVWFDALINYLTGSGKNEEHWPADSQIIGKGILWFHAVIWPAILFASDRELPKEIAVHSYFTINGQKMSKSLRNVINPLDLLKIYPADSVRYFITREISFENDGDFSETKLKTRHNEELANKLGNLISRVSTLAEKYGIENTDSELKASNLVKEIEKNIKEYHTNVALDNIFAYIDKCNEYVQSQKPWQTEDSKVLYELVLAIKNIAILLNPFMPETSEKIAKTFNFKISLDEIDKPLKSAKPGEIKKSEILFKKIQ